ncbi:MAG: L-glutaminase [Chromatiaceae bacterium]|jgi:glutaminase|nr:L-glutaminase [Chromatiaceae bacterium]
MAATLANGGVNPATGDAVIDAIHCQHVLAVMVTAGLYENSGDWLYDTGLPGKSGVSGGMITIAPGKGALATFSPPLDEAGNSVKGQLTARFLSEQLGLNLFASRPAPVADPSPDPG